MISTRSLAMFNHFAQCQDTKRLPAIPLDPNGYTAAECFHAKETHGKDLPCREPELLSRAFNGKAWHGVTVTMVAEDFVAGMISHAEILKNYPAHTAREIAARASQIAEKNIGFVPNFLTI